MNICQILNKYIPELNSRGPHLDAEILLSFILKRPREFILTHPEYELTKSQITKYKLLIRKRSSGMPIAYLIGEKEFYGNKFLANKNVLVPRPETELMVEEAVKISNFEFRNTKNICFIDVGTGSGCIIISLAKIIANYKLHKNYKFFGIDISQKALGVAKENAVLNKVFREISFLQGDLLKPILDSRFRGNDKKKSFSKFKIQNSKLIILANLPYLTPEQIKNSPSIKYEPKLALSAGRDGLKYYRKLFKQLKRLNMLHVMCYVLCEIDPNQKNSITALIKKGFPDIKFEIKKDLKGHNRLAIIKL